MVTVGCYPVSATNLISWKHCSWTPIYCSHLLFYFRLLRKLAINWEEGLWFSVALLIYCMLLSYVRIISDSCQLGERLITTFVMPLLLGWGTYWVDKNSFSSPSFSPALFIAPALSFPLSSLLSVLLEVWLSSGSILESFREAMEVLTAAHNLLPAAVSFLFPFWLQRDVVWWFSCLSGANVGYCVCVCETVFAGLCIAIG